MRAPAPDRSAELRRQSWSRTAATARFVAAWAFLNLVVNLRFPGPEPGRSPWYLLPSLDVTALLVGFAVLGWTGRRCPRWLIVGLTVILLGVRAFRLGDGLVEEAYRRRLNLLLDVPLLPELARLLRSTVSPVALGVGTLVGLLALGGMIFLLARAVGHCARHLTTPGRADRARKELAAIVLVTTGLSPLWPGTTSEGHVGLFGASVLPPLTDQVRFVADARRLRESKAREIAAVRSHLAETPSGLERLAGADVLIFFVESYGITAYTQPQMAEPMRVIHDGFAGTLGRLDLAVATGLLDAPVQGGQSWMAHATFAAGVRIADGLEFALLRQTRPPPSTMAGFFQRAGYRTVLVQPGTTRPWPEGEVTGFERRYYAPDLGYQGPEFEWAPMPDQYVVDFVDRREIAPSNRPPLFAEFALVSSHAPWSLQPQVVDWERLSGGQIYNQLAPIRFPITWQSLASGADAYVASLGYDFTVLGQYLARLSRPNTLVIILGDHQPTAALTRAGPAHEVPVHVISGNRALVQAFVDDAGESGRGVFVPGMRPKLGAPAAGMETFLVDLLRRLSHPRAPGGMAVTATAPTGATTTGTATTTSKIQVPISAATASP